MSIDIPKRSLLGLPFHFLRSRFPSETEPLLGLQSSREKRLAMTRHIELQRLVIAGKEEKKKKRGIEATDVK
jgi:hypothetical protein